MLDTKLKNSRRVRIALAILFLIILTVGNFFIFPRISMGAENQISKEISEYYGTHDEADYTEVNEDVITQLLYISYVTYYDMLTGEQLEQLPGYVDWIMADWRDAYGHLYNQVDYWAGMDGTVLETNTAQNMLLESNEENTTYLYDNYEGYLMLEYDDAGRLTVTDVGHVCGIEGELTRIVSQEEKNVAMGYQSECESYAYDYSTEEYQPGATGVIGLPRNCKILFAFTDEFPLYFEYDEYDFYWSALYSYAENGGAYLYWGSVIIILVVVCLLTSKFIWREKIDYKRPGICYLAELAIIGLFVGMAAQDAFFHICYRYGNNFQNRNVIEVITGGRMENLYLLAEIGLNTILIYALWYLCFLFIRPVFSLGIKEYIRQYSLIYFICTKVIGWMKRGWKTLKYEVTHLDFTQKHMKVIRKVVIVNFLILAILSCFWFFGIFILIVYSVALFFFLKKQYEKVGADYQKLLEATSRIGQGDLQCESEEDWGIFEAFKGEINNIRSGFSKAVAEEVKSQKMKTELITNVSHDLKTPLTAITTYVELLKDPNLTEEQRKSYIEILEKKSLRLKVLVEDLFEVSKANSENIKLDLMEVDVMNLLKQVSVEHEEHFTDKGISLKWNLPEEKITLMLDNQKTYRIFENLFVNIEKYAMENSRVYIDVLATDEVQITIRNISAQELNISGEEITERFVRGDDSRTTEGSGLGLAIAKSFTEAQGGTFKVVVDGDLFKVMICWK